MTALDRELLPVMVSTKAHKDSYTLCLRLFVFSVYHLQMVKFLVFLSILIHYFHALATKQKITCSQHKTRMRVMNRLLEIIGLLAGYRQCKPNMNI